MRGERLLEPTNLSRGAFFGFFLNWKETRNTEYFFPLWLCENDTDILETLR